MRSVDEMIADIIRREGGYNDVKGDKGGATNLGVSLRYAKGVGLDLDGDGDTDKDDIRLVTPEVAAQLYREDFLQEPRIDRLHPDVQPQVFDMAVNHGPPRAIMIVQKALRHVTNERVEVDGVVGPQTRRILEDAVERFGPATINNMLATERESFYHRIVLDDPSQAKFLEGWLNRNDEFKS